MKKYIIICMCLVIGNLSAQQWETNVTKAKEIAFKEHKKTLLVFQGSDWCAPCIKLDREVWSTSVFKKYAEDHFILLKADFPKRKKNRLSKEQQDHNNQLAEEYNKKGYFPYVVVLDENGKLLGTTSYKKMTARAYIQLLESF
ncbi:MAG: thioredoxin family protein [Flavobacteriaceae bacterium]|nr:thioredoxin family protein [Flavobacteriaceae bacterium]